MKLLDFLSGLLPRMFKNDILEDIRITSSELEKGVIPEYREAIKYFNSKRFSANVLVEMNTIYVRNNKLKNKQTNFVAGIEFGLKNLKENLDFVKAELETLLEKDIFRDGLTAKKSVLVRAAEHISFLTRYSIDLLGYIYTNETMAVDKDNLGDEFKVSPIQEKNIQRFFVTYVNLMNVYCDDTKRFADKYSNIPDIVVNVKNYENMSAIFNADSIDPFSSAMVQNFESNPIYHFRLMIAEWQAARYKTYKDKKRKLELQLLNLKMINEKKKDAALEKEIIYLQDRIDTLEFKMKKMEDSVQ